MAWDRNERVEALLKEKIAIIVLERLNDPRLGFVTITGVKLSRDKRQARVLFTVLGNAAQRRTTERALHDAVPHVQKQIAPSMHLRSMPELRFAYDETVAKESRMLGILDELASSRGEHLPDPAQAGAAGEERAAQTPGAVEAADEISDDEAVTDAAGDGEDDEDDEGDEDDEDAGGDGPRSG